MAVLIRQELYKLFKRKKTLVVIIAFVLLTAFLCYGIRQNAYFMQEYSTPEFQIENLESHNAYLETELDHVPEDIEGNAEETEQYRDNIRDEIERNQEEIKRLEASINRNLSWEEALEEDIQAQEEFIEANSSKVDSGDLVQRKMELEELKYLQAHGIEPQQEYDFNAFKYINDLVEQLGQVFLVIGISVFAADMVSGEWTPPTMKLLLAQPVSRRKVLFSKIIATIIAAVGLILLIEILSFIIVGVFFDLGDMNYPMVINKAFEYDYSVFLEDGTHPLALIDGSWDIVPVWQYSLKLLGNQALFIMAVTSFVFMISTIAKSSMVSMGVSVVSLIAGSIIFQISSFYGISKFVFTSYSSLGAMITGDLAMYFNNPQFTGMRGFIVMIAWTVLCYICSHIFFTKRDMLV